MILQIVAIVLIVLFFLLMLVPFRISATGVITLASRNFEIVMSWLGIPVYRIKMHEPILRSLFFRSPSRFESVIQSVEKAFRFRQLKGELTFGTGDPADTAVLAGYLWSVSSFLGGLFPPVDFSINPDLDNVVLEGSLKAQAMVRLGFVVAILLRMYAMKPIRWLLTKFGGPG